MKLDWGDDEPVNGVDDDDGDTKSDSEIERQDKLKGHSVEVEDAKNKKPELIMVSLDVSFCLLGPR